MATKATHRNSKILVVFNCISFVSLLIFAGGGMVDDSKFAKTRRKTKRYFLYTMAEVAN
jgi:hypothetical protein